MALAILGVVAINLYVQSSASQQRIERALSSALRVPVHVTSTIVTPWSGLKASGITVPQPAQLPGNFLEAANFGAYFDWLALFHHRLAVSRVALNQPRVAWFQTGQGRWQLPSEAAKEKLPGTTAPAEPALPKKAPGGGRAWQISIHRLEVNDGAFDFYDEKGRQMLELSGVQFDCADPKAASTEGRASAKNAALHDQLFLRDLTTKWSFEKGTLKLSSFQAAVGGGDFRGDAEMATKQKHSPFYVDARFDRVDTNELLSDAGTWVGKVKGALSGWMELYGNSGKTSSMNGRGQLKLAGGHLQDVEVFAAIGQALQIPDLVDLQLKTAEADVRVVNGTMWVDRMILQSQNLKVETHGTVESNGKVALEARMSIGPVISERIPAFILRNFKESETGDMRYVDFKFKGPLSHPGTDLMEKILGRQIQSEMTGLIMNLFGKKKKAPEPSPAVSGSGAATGEP